MHAWDDGIESIYHLRTSLVNFLVDPSSLLFHVQNLRMISRGIIPVPLFHFT